MNSKNSRDSKAATLRDVARAAGVSVASASRALSRGGIGAELQSRIEAAAQRLEYRANLAARALVSRRSGVVEIVVDRVADSLFAEALVALERRLRSADYAVLLASSESADPGRSGAPILPRDAEAIVYIGTRPPDPEIERLRRESLPWVSVCDAPVGEGTFIDVGRHRGSMLATRYLLDLGHRRFGVCAAASQETRRGVAAALIAAGGTMVGTGEGDGEASPVEGWSPIRALLDNDDPPTAIVCGSDLEALAAVRECALRGIDVPGKISVVGFGDREFARHTRPALTTVRISAAAIGTAAGELVLAALRGEPTRLVELPLKLVVRETTAAAG